MSRFLLPLYLCSLFFFFTACTSHTYEDVIEEIPQEQEPNLVTYQEVKFIFETSCVQCHANPPQNGAPMPLVSFQNVKEAIQNRGLLDRISREEGAPGLMPLGGPRLPQQSIDLIFQWNEDGLTEN